MKTSMPSEHETHRLAAPSSRPYFQRLLFVLAHLLSVYLPAEPAEIRNSSGTPAGGRNIGQHRKHLAEHKIDLGKPAQSRPGWLSMPPDTIGAIEGLDDSA
jgi:hypothetical protein